MPLKFVFTRHLYKHGSSCSFASLILYTMAQTQNRLLTATRIHNGHGWMPAESCIEVAEDGIIIAIHPENTGGKAEHFDGILVPGFVNAHCHLELSHLKDLVPEGTGLIPFLQAIPVQRNNFTDEQKKAARIDAYHELLRNGIVAVGDIANSNETLDVRLLDGLHLHTFVECIGFTEAFAPARLAYSVEVMDAFAAQKANEKLLRQSVIPHAPYSVSGALFRLINELDPDSLISIHNQESPAEDAYYQSKTGDVRKLLLGLGIDDAFFVPTGKSSLQSYLPYFSAMHPLILVHNTCTTEEDIRFTQSRSNKIFWCLCPNANQYIEQALPDVKMLLEHGAEICIGTDSLASNHQLSVLDELHVLKQAFPFLNWEDLLRWGTLNGARALRMNNRIGSIEPGKQPGILYLENTESKRVMRIL